MNTTNTEKKNKGILYGGIFLAFLIVIGGCWYGGIFGGEKKEAEQTENVAENKEEENNEKESN